MWLKHWSRVEFGQELMKRRDVKGNCKMHSLFKYEMSKVLCDEVVLLLGRCQETDMISWWDS